MSGREKRLVVALDVPDLAEAQRAIAQLRSDVPVFKVGLELFTAAGPDAVRAVHDVGAHCFLDLKLHDIPATVAGAAASAAALGVRYLTLHTSAGMGAMRAAADAVRGSRTELLAVTVLTSMDAAELAAIGWFGSPAQLVLELARRAVESGMHGLVCSGHECAALRSDLGPDPILVVPGIRPTGDDVDDQRRVMTPHAAITAGADLLVVGRPIRNAKDPVAAARAITHEMIAALTPS